MTETFTAWVLASYQFASPARQYKLVGHDGEFFTEAVFCYEDLFGDKVGRHVLLTGYATETNSNLPPGTVVQRHVYMQDQLVQVDPGDPLMKVAIADTDFIEYIVITGDVFDMGRNTGGSGRRSIWCKGPADAYKKAKEMSRNWTNVIAVFPASEEIKL